MSTPINPLAGFATYQVRHVLAAFKYTTDAESAELTSECGKIGDEVKGTPNSRVIINEFSDGRFMLRSLVSSWSNHGPTGQLTTSMSGTLTIADATGGHFIDRFIEQVTQELEMSAQQLTFSLKTFFMGIKTGPDGSRYDDVVHGQPLIFHVHEFNDQMNVKGVGTTIEVGFTAAYNTSAQSPTLCKPYQVTLTHKDGNLNNISPEVFAPDSGIKSRATEDGIKSEPRKDRMVKSKPMRNLKDLFDAFEFELNQQKFVHKAQVQEWIGIIRDDYERKIKKPKQVRGDELPIEFHVELDPVFNNYPVDNRNLPFEQVEEKIKSNGVSSVPIRAGATITEIVSQLMRYSRTVGDDAMNPPLDDAFKINISYLHEPDNKIHVYIKVKQMVLPHNTKSFGDSGPGDGAITPLEFTFKSGQTEDLDITHLKTSLGTDSGIIPLESGERVAVYGNREPVMGERIPPSAGGTEYFKSEYSGLRVPLFHRVNGGLEDAVAGANVSLSYFVINDQSSTHEIEIIGNPHLMFDLNRKPSDAAKLDTPGKAELYMYPESHPMYLKIKIYLKADAVIGETPIDPSTISDVNYYKNYYEIVGVVNNLTNGGFYQHIMLEKTDNIL